MDRDTSVLRMSYSSQSPDTKTGGACRTKTNVKTNHFYINGAYFCRPLAKTFQEIPADVRLRADLDVEVGTVVFRTQTIKIVFTRWHFFVGNFV